MIKKRLIVLMVLCAVTAMANADRHLEFEVGQVDYGFGSSSYEQSFKNPLALTLIFTMFEFNKSGIGLETYFQSVAKTEGEFTHVDDSEFGGTFNVSGEFSTLSTGFGVNKDIKLNNGFSILLRGGLQIWRAELQEQVVTDSGTPISGLIYLDGKLYNNQSTEYGIGPYGGAGLSFHINTHSTINVGYQMQIVDAELIDGYVQKVSIGYKFSF